MDITRSNILRAALALISLLGASGLRAADAEYVELEWMSDVRVTAGAVSGDPVHLQGTRDRCAVALAASTPRSVRVTNDAIHVEVEIQRNPLCIPGPRAEVTLALGSVETGDRLLIVSGYDATTPDKRYVLPASARGELSVSVAAPGPLQALHSGIWSVPGKPGEGLYVDVIEQGAVFTYFGKKENGEHLWLVSDLMLAHETLTRLYEYQGGTFDAPRAMAVQWGVLEITHARDGFCRGLRARMLHQGQLVKELQLTKLTAPRSQPACTVHSP